MNTNLVYLTIKIYINYAFTVIKLAQKKWLIDILFKSTSGKIAVMISFISLGLIMYAYGVFNV
jgi:hypothetical protein